MTPDIYFKYNKSVPFDERVNTVLSWFDLPEKNRCSFNNYEKLNFNVC